MNNRNITDEQLVAYVDGTLDEALKSEVEAMIESSDEMKEKVEAIRKTNLILSQVSKELQNEPLPQDIQNLIESHKQQEQRDQLSQPSILEKLSKLFDFSSAMPAYSMAALLVFSIGINFYLLTDGNDEGMDLVGYSNQLIERNELKFRGPSDGMDAIFTKTLKNMHREKNSLSRLDYGSESFVISIDKLISKNNGIYCYEGNIKSLNEKFKYIFCIDSDEETSFISNPH